MTGFSLGGCAGSGARLDVSACAGLSQREAVWFGAFNLSLPSRELFYLELCFPAELGGEHPMAKLGNYKTNAQECRALARKAGNEEHRNNLLRMAEAWDNFAVEHERSNRSDQIGGLFQQRN